MLVQENNDENLAKHVTYVHRENKHPPLDAEPFSPEFLRAYIAKAKTFDPWVPKELTDFIVGSYVSLRKVLPVILIGSRQLTSHDLRVCRRARRKALRRRSSVAVRATTRLPDAPASARRGTIAAVSSLPSMLTLCLICLQFAAVDPASGPSAGPPAFPRCCHQRRR